MKHIMLASALAVGLGLLSPVSLAGTAAAGPVAGYDRVTVRSDHRPGPIAASIWYRAKSPAYRALVGDNAVFNGTPAYIGATIEAGKHPLVLLSHGSGGNMDNLSWLSSELARHGAIVLAVNHPGSTTGDSSPRRSVRLNGRALDLSAALDTILVDPAFGKYIDPTRISAVGFSLGGTTVLNLAGMRLDRLAYKRYCDDLDGHAVDCLFFANGGVDLTRLPDSFAADMRDFRIRTVVAIDPALTYAATDDSVAGMTLPVSLINLGRKSLWAEVDVGPDGSGLVDRLPNARRTVFAPAHHFTFLGLCKPGGAALLEQERDDPVCTDPEGTDRAKIHRQIVRKVVEFLKL